LNGRNPCWKRLEKGEREGPERSTLIDDLPLFAVPAAQGTCKAGGKGTIADPTPILPAN
jgi:hypothetical protein